MPNMSAAGPLIIVLVYKLSTSKIRLLSPDTNLSGLEGLLKHKRRSRKLWQVTQDPECKIAVNWVTKTIREMTCRKAFKWWETKTGNCEITLQALWPITKSLMKRDGPKAPFTVHSPSGKTSLKQESQRDCII
jgi:hypothetical protein